MSVINDKITEIQQQIIELDELMNIELTDDSEIETVDFTLSNVMYILADLIQEEE